VVKTAHPHFVAELARRVGAGGRTDRWPAPVPEAGNMPVPGGAREPWRSLEPLLHLVWKGPFQ
jgi:hypothetical protein